MIGASIQKSPPRHVVLPHFIAGSLAFLILSVLFFFSSDILSVYFYNPRILAITHVITIAWITMFIMGSLYQLIPVIFEVKLYSSRLAVFNFWFLVTGLFGFIFAFWNSRFNDLMPVFSSQVFISIWIFCVNIILSYKNTIKKDISGKLIISAVIWLVLTSFIGILLAFNYKYAFLDNSNFRYLKMHAAFGLIGWFLQLVMGVASTLIPMFLVSHKLRFGLLKKAFYFINSGIAILYIFWQFGLPDVFFIMGSIVISSSIFFFLLFIYDSYKKKLRKLDIGMKHSMLAFLLLLLPVILGLVISSGINNNPVIINKIILIYGFSAFFAFFTNLILGQALKTIPFIVWLHRYQHLVGKTKTPMPSELYSEKIGKAQFYIFNLMVLILICGIITGSEFGIKAGSLLMIITAILFNINIIKIIFIKKQIDEN